MDSRLKENKLFKGFQILSCQFALHYFFKDQQSLETVFKYYVPLLVKGGYFIGTCANGKSITDLLGKEKTYTNNLLNITKKFNAEKPRNPFGNAYSFNLNDEFDGANYFNSMGESIEYLVNTDTLVETAGRYDLKPVYINLFEQNEQGGYTIIHSIKDKQNFVTFEEIYKLTKPPLSPDELVINNLYTTFIFIKN
jgi:mRNA (guanine-N7-)-methyltransferase